MGNKESKDSMHKLSGERAESSVTKASAVKTKLNFLSWVLRMSAASEHEP